MGKKVLDAGYEYGPGYGACVAAFVFKLFALVLGVLTLLPAFASTEVAKAPEAAADKGVRDTTLATDSKGLRREHAQPERARSTEARSDEEDKPLAKRAPWVSPSMQQLKLAS
eukprot:scaffold50045_cov57-Phaeocystis_antarctica.AAC.4